MNSTNYMKGKSLIVVLFAQEFSSHSILANELKKIV